MAKVTQSKAGKAQGATPEPKKATGLIYAIRNGQKRTFRKQVWDHLPPNKEDWKEISNVPEEPASKEDKPKANSKKAEGKVPTPLAGDKKGSEEDSKPAKTKVLTQEDLDLNPDLAIQGLKVGETIEIDEEEDGE